MAYGDMATKEEIEHRSVVDSHTDHHHPHHHHRLEHEVPINTGVDTDQIQPGYWRSPRFIGSCIAIIFQGNSLFFGYAVPTNLLSVINADLGES